MEEGDNGIDNIVVNNALQSEASNGPTSNSTPTHDSELDDEQTNSFNEPDEVYFFI